MSNEMFYFNDKNVDEMSKEELIQAVKILGTINNNLHSAFKSYQSVQNAAINYYKNK